MRMSGFWTSNKLNDLKANELSLISKSNRMFKMSNFEYIIGKSICYENEFNLFINLVHSSPMHFERRSVCRDTWAHSDPRIKTYFLLGAVDSKPLQRRITAEEAQFHDIIQGNFLDTYHNLTYKHTMALKWFSENCDRVKYLVKLDDDVFVNVPAVYDYLLANKVDQNFLLGPSLISVEVHRNGKWGVSQDEFGEEFYPEFVEGSTVIYSNDFVRNAYQKTFTTDFFWLDDVYVTGLIRTQLNVKIMPIYQYLLSGDALKSVLNGTTSVSPNSSFLFSEQSRKTDDIRKLWNYTESYRKSHELNSISLNDE